MKGHEIKVGGTYLAKVSGRLVKVLVELAFERRTCVGGQDASRTAWRAVNLETGRTIVVKSAQRLRPLPAPPAICICVDCQHCAPGCEVCRKQREEREELEEWGGDRAAARHHEHADEGESGPDYGGAFDGHNVISDADPGL